MLLEHQGNLARYRLTSCGTEWVMEKQNWIAGDDSTDHGNNIKKRQSTGSQGSEIRCFSLAIGSKSSLACGLCGGSPTSFHSTEQDKGRILL